MDQTPLPRPALWLGLAGLLPFLGLAVLVTMGREAAVLGGAAMFAYAATILSFLGAVHWGLALRAPPSEASALWPRLALGVLPALVAWVALILPIVLGLGVLAIGILATAAVETLAARRGLVPMGYLRLRWVLSAGATLSLAAGIATNS